MLTFLLLHEIQASETEESTEISLMLSKEQQDKLRAFKDIKKEDASRSDQQENSQAYLITGIIYSAPEIWTVWINEQPYGPQSSILEPGVTIRALDHRSAELTIQGLKHIIFPGQSFVTKFDEQ